MVQQRREPCFLVPSCYPRTRSSALGTSGPALCPGRVLLVVFPSASPLPSTTSAAAGAALFGGFAGTTGLSDFPPSFISGVRPRPSLRGPRPRLPPANPDGARRAMGSPGSRAWRFHACKGSLTARGPPTARDNAADDVAFRLRTASAPRNPGFRGSIALPAGTPVNASPPPSRTPTHDSGPPWCATPSMSDSFIPYSMPVYPGVQRTYVRVRGGPRYSEPEAREAIGASISFSEALRRLGMRPAGGNHMTLKKYAQIWAISTAHFDPAATRIPRRRAVPLEQVLIEHSTYSRQSLKQRLYAEGFKRRQCRVVRPGRGMAGPAAWR